eukprot:TRINITY_DN3824_c0_g1_i1.p1 TRINITY_DN3824_c0_g1~~TRINITY_DN3824_c0_g1_i1.p1  ORF type:complete len:153 (+),score=35.51 TRINITY_DN3824_c0_g1_i1:61-519(+)
MKIFVLLLCVVALVSCSHFKYSDCAKNGDGRFTKASMTQDLKHSKTAFVNATLVLDQPITGTATSGAIWKTTVKYFGMRLHTKQDFLCKGGAGSMGLPPCSSGHPLPAATYEMSSKMAIPSEAPSGDYEFVVEAHYQETGHKILCLSSKFSK